MKIPEKYFRTREDFKYFLESKEISSREWMHGRIVQAIKTAFKKGDHIADIFDARIEESMSTIRMTAESEDWITTLELAMQWNVEVERYEICSEIKKLIDDINMFNEQDNKKNR